MECSERYTSIYYVRNGKLCKKNFAVIIDNASTIIQAVKLLKCNHIACYTHCLNFIRYYEGTAPKQYIIQKIKSIVQHLKKSSHALYKLHKTQTHAIIESKTHAISFLFAEPVEIKISSDAWIIFEHLIKDF